MDNRKLTKKKAFTVIELVIVIGIIGILSAILIPTFSNLRQKANVSRDTALVRNLNTAISIEKVSGATYDYPQQAIDSVKKSGFSTSDLRASSDGNEILWDSANDLFCYYNAGSGSVDYLTGSSPKTTAKDEDLFKFYQVDQQRDDEGVLDLSEDRFSAYLASNNFVTKVLTNKGVDTGDCVNIEEVDYTNSTEKTVTIKTSSFGTTLKINAHNDTVKHYGFASVIDIEDIKSTSYHEYGMAGKLKIASGHAVVEEKGTVYSIIDLDGAGDSASIDTKGTVCNNKTEDTSCNGSNHTLELLVVDSNHVYEVCSVCGYINKIDTFDDVDWSNVNYEGEVFPNYSSVNVLDNNMWTQNVISHTPVHIDDDPTSVEIPTYTYCQINEVVKSYLDEVTYTATGESLVSNYSSISTSYNKDRPVGCTVDLVAGTLTVTDNDTDNSYTEEVSAGPYTFYNITPGVGGEFVVRDSNSNILQQGHLRPTGSLRMIYTEGAWNARDLGGWACDGGTVKYNKLIRGGNPIGLTTWDKNTWVKLTGIDNDLFLAEDANYPTDSSPIGPNVTFQRTTLLDETKPNAYETWESARLNGKANLIFNNLLDNAIAGKTTYFHCLAAADRTGMTAYVVEAILGMHESDIDKDYELTSFYTTTSPRTRKNTYVQFLDARYDGENLRDKAVNYLLECGISIEKINAFRNAVIDGNPEQLYDLDESERVNIATTFTNCVVSNSVGSQFVRNNSNSYASTSNTINAVYGETYTLSLSNEANVNSLGVTQLVFYDDDGTITEITSNTTLHKGDTIRYKTKNSNTTHVAIRSHGDVEAHNNYITFRGPAYVEQSLPAPVDNIKHLTLNLTDCTSNATTTDLTKYEAFSLDLTPSSGYCFAEGGIIVTMGGVDITSTALSGTHISIDSVTSNVVVTANAIQEGYSSVISSITSTNNLADPTGDDWKNNSRGSYSSEISTSSGNILTNKIIVENGDVIFVKGLSMNNSGVLYSLLYTTTHNPFLPESDTTFISDFGTSGEWKYFTINTTGATGLRICATTPSNIGNVVICVYRDGNLVDSTSLVVDPLTAATTTIGNTTSSNNFASPNAINWDSDSGYGSTTGVYYNNVTGYTTTNYIPAQIGDIIFVKDMTFDAANGHGRSELFNSSMDALGWTYILANNNNGKLSEVGSTGQWVYFTINDSNSSYIRLSGHVANAENVSICVYRNGNWLVAPEQPILDPLNSAISAIEDATSSNNFADIKGDDWHINSGYGSTAGAYYRNVTGYTTTNFISVQKGDVVLVKGMAFESATSIGHARSEVFDSSKTGLGWTYIVDGSTNNKIKNVGSSGDWVYYIVDDNSTAYIRMCGQVANVDNVAICVYRPGVGLLTVQ